MSMAGAKEGRRDAEDDFFLPAPPTAPRQAAKHDKKKGAALVLPPAPPLPLATQLSVVEASMDGCLNHRFLVMFLAQDFVDEGEEFLYYFYPSDSPQAPKMVEMRGLFTSLNGATIAACGQRINVALFNTSQAPEESKLKEMEQEGNEEEGKATAAGIHFKVATVELGQWAHKLTLALLHWAPDHPPSSSSPPSSSLLLSDHAIAQVCSSLVSLLSFTLGPLPAGIFQPLGDSSSSSSSSSPSPPRYRRCFHAMLLLDPVLRRCADSLFSLDERQVVTSSLGEGVAWFATSRDLAVILHTRLEQQLLLDSTLFVNSAAPQDFEAPSGSRRGPRTARAAGACLLYRQRMVCAVGECMQAPQQKLISLFLMLHTAAAASDAATPYHFSSHLVFTGSDSSPHVLAIASYGETFLCFLILPAAYPNAGNEEEHKEQSAAAFRHSDPFSHSRRAINDAVTLGARRAMRTVLERLVESRLLEGVDEEMRFAEQSISSVSDVISNTLSFSSSSSPSAPDAQTKTKGGEIGLNLNMFAYHTHMKKPPSGLMHYLVFDTVHGSVLEQPSSPAVPLSLAMSGVSSARISTSSSYSFSSFSSLSDSANAMKALSEQVHTRFVQTCVKIRTALHALKRARASMFNVNENERKRTNDQDLGKELHTPPHSSIGTPAEKIFLRKHELEATLGHVGEHGVRIVVPIFSSSPVAAATASSAALGGGGGKRGRSATSSAIPQSFSIRFWSVGRLYPNEIECFICFHEDVPPESVEHMFDFSYKQALLKRIDASLIM